MTPKKKLAIAFFLVGLGIVLRLVPHAWNVAPVAAVALAAGAYLGPRFGAAVPLAVLLVSDIALGGYEAGVMIAVYLSFVATGLLGVFVGRSVRVETVLGGALASSTLFFFVTNWAHWQFTAMYPMNAGGLLASYWYALPFFRNTLVGDLLYTAVIFGAFELVRALVLRAQVRFAAASALRPQR